MISSVANSYPLIFQYSSVQPPWISVQSLIAFTDSYNTGNSEVPFSFFFVVILQCFTLLSVVKISICNFSNVAKSTNAITAFKVIFCIFTFYLVDILYQLYLPTLYLPPFSNKDKMISRIFLQTFVMEILSYLFRNGISSADIHIRYKTRFIIFPELLSSLYSRFLVTSVTDTLLLAMLSIITSFFDLASKLSAKKRDELFRKVYTKLTGKQMQLLESNHILSNLFSKMKTICEIASIITVSSFFIFILNPSSVIYNGNLSNSVNFEYYRGLGYVIENIILKDCAIQLVIEFASVFLLMILDTFLKVGIFEVSSLKLFFYDINILICAYIAFSFSFFGIFFMFPLPFGKGNHSGQDLQGTWLAFVQTLQFPYLKLWLTESMECFTKQKYCVA